jgi:hypothetical protein
MGACEIAAQEMEISALLATSTSIADATANFTRG